MENCIFCQIVAGKSTCHKVYEDEMFLGFLDIYPRSKGHTLLIPKKHYNWTYDVPEFGAYWLAVLKITKAVQKTLKPEFINYFTYGFHVSHAHIHIVPHYSQIGEKEDTFIAKEKEMSEIAKKIYEEVKKNG